MCAVTPGPHRPQFHVTAPSGWLNDPNGLTHRNGVYHLFYQLNPYAPVHDRIHWGHASSPDLVHWVDEPIALRPSEDGPDQDGCWSGVLVDNEGTPTIIYTGRRGEAELPCLAVGSTDLRTWTTHPGNPVIPHTPPGVEVLAYRDHCVWREDGRWRQLVGAGVNGRGGTAFLYESEDLLTWDLIGPLVAGSSTQPARAEPLWTGTVWECVDLFRVCEDGTSSSVGDPVARAKPGTDVLVFSVWDDGITHYPLYLSGTYADDTFVPESVHRLDYGGRFFYAPQSMADAAGRRIMFGWLQEGRSEGACIRDGWAGVMSVPRLVTVRPDGTLAQQPVPELTGLRGAGNPPVALTAKGGDAHPLGSGDQLDIEVEAQLEPGAALDLLVCASPDGEELTTIRVARDPSGTASVTLDRSQSSQGADHLDTIELSGPVTLDTDGTVALRVLVDHSALEVFVNGHALTARVYPSRADATGVSISAPGGQVQVQQAQLWPMAGALDR